MNLFIFRLFCSSDWQIPFIARYGVTPCAAVDFAEFLGCFATMQDFYTNLCCHLHGSTWQRPSALCSIQGEGGSSTQAGILKELLGKGDSPRCVVVLWHSLKPERDLTGHEREVLRAAASTHSPTSITNAREFPYHLLQGKSAAFRESNGSVPAEPEEGEQRRGGDPWGMLSRSFKGLC